MNCILDTCVISELTKPKPHKSVVAWFNACAPEELRLCVITVAELHYGIEVLPEGKRRNDLRAWLIDVKNAYQGCIVEVSIPVWLRWAEERVRLKKAGLQIPIMDGLIACAALETGYTLVTRNTGDFSAFNIRLFNPWLL